MRLHAPGFPVWCGGGGVSGLTPRGATPLPACQGLLASQYGEGDHAGSAAFRVQLGLRGLPGGPFRQRCTLKNGWVRPHYPRERSRPLALLGSTALDDPLPEHAVAAFSL